MCDAITRKVSDDDRPRADNGVVPNPDTSLDDTAVTYVYILPNEDLLCDLSAITALESLDVGRSFQGRDNHTISYLRVHSNGNPGGVVEFAIRPNHDILSNGQVVAIVAKEWCGNVYVTAKMADNGMLCSVWWYPPGSDNGFEATSTLILCNAHRSIGCTVELVHCTSTMCTLVD